uniref:stearoyl-CoA desaturase 5-like n=1 Tax=Styela clava TaxID=7725 RepID=UPI00193A457A|nr:stearoyl-CoA desaturase 5-like [Styela clava]XP_039265590.1 stearoyl-CoA desaturase 5-like [Styela clava]
MTEEIEKKKDIQANGWSAGDRNGNIPHEKINERFPDIKPSMQIIWKNVIIMSYIHLFSVYAIVQLRHCFLKTLLFGFITGFFSELGVTAGAHRLWTHRSYKAKLPLRTFLMIINTLALQNSIFDWSRDHRSHHKYSETDADPHNARRGFFFCHIGWLMVRKHPDVIRKGKNIPLNDLLDDPVIAFQRKYFLLLAPLCCFIIPSIIPWYFWGETLWNGYCMSVLRYCCVLNITWTVNSFAHLFGDRPYDRTIHPAENYFVSLAAIGEGFHNYHHTFPSDYSTSEYGYRLNPTTAFIDLMAFIGQAYDRKSTTKNAIQSRMKRTGKYSDIKEAGW